MDPAITAAIIGAIALIIIGIIKSLISKRNRDRTTTSIQAGRDSFYAKDKATQKVSINVHAPPESPKLITVAEEILKETNECLVENERTLTPLFKNPAERYSVGERMVELFEKQQLRGAFGKWKAFLENTLNAETNTQIKNSIDLLLKNVRKLYTSFYSYSNSVQDKGLEETKKHFVELVLGNRGSDPRWYCLSDKEVVSIARNYLDFLRQSIEDIGNATGQLKSLIL